MTMFLVLVSCDGALCLPSLSPHLPFFHSLCHCIRDATLGAGQEKKLAGGKGASDSLLSSPDRSERHCILSHFCTLRVSWVKKTREAVCRRHLQIPVFIKIDCGAHIKSTFLCFLPMLVHGGACTLSEHSSGAQEGEPGTQRSQPQHLVPHGSCCMIASSLLSSLCCRTNSYGELDFVSCSPRLRSCFPKRSRAITHVLTPLHARPSLPRLVTAEQARQLLPNLQRDADV